MGQKTNPIGNRLGIIRGWDSNWYGGRRFEAKLVEDDKIRKYLNARLAKAIAATIRIVFSDAALAPTAELRKLTASLLTPTLRSITANINRTQIIAK